MSLSLREIGKWSMIAIVLGVGVAGGAYLGYGWSFKQAERAAELESRRRAAGNVDARFLTVGDGDLFPLENATDSTGRVVMLGDVLKERDALVIFADWQCDACLNLLRFVQSDVIPNAQRGVSFIIVSKRESGNFPSVYGGLLKKATVVYIDGADWGSRYKLERWPTIIGVDFSGFITHVQIGFSGAIDHELVDRYLDI